MFMKRVFSRRENIGNITLDALTFKIAVNLPIKSNRSTFRVCLLGKINKRKKVVLGTVQIC